MIRSISRPHADQSPSTVRSFALLISHLNFENANSIGLKIADRPLPANRKIIKQVALQLCDGFDHMRCDLYLVGNKIFFGEYTVYNQGGYMLLENDDQLLAAQGESWDVRQSWFLTQPQPGLHAVYAKALLELLNTTEAT